VDLKPKVAQDEWGTSSREAYEDRPHFQQVRVKKPVREGSPFLRSVGGTLMVAGTAWGAYILVTSGGTQNVLQAPGPVLTCLAGIVLSLLAKLF